MIKKKKRQNRNLHRRQRRGGGWRGSRPRDANATWGGCMCSCRGMCRLRSTSSWREVPPVEKNMLARARVGGDVTEGNYMRTLGMEIHSARFRLSHLNPLWTWSQCLVILFFKWKTKNIHLISSVQPGKDVRLVSFFSCRRQIRWSRTHSHLLNSRREVEVRPRGDRSSYSATSPPL